MLKNGMWSAALSLILLAGSGSAIAQQSNDLDALVEHIRSEFRIPGIAVGVVRDGRVILSKGYGFRDMDRRLPVTVRTVFPIGSITKSFTALAIATLVDDGLLQWDRPVREYVPGFRLEDPIATELVTFRDMLAQRTGVPRYDFLWMSQPLSRQELVRRLAYLPPSVSFRERFQYCNLMCAAAGHLAGEIARSSWEELVTHRVLRRLEMNDSNTSVSDSEKTRDYAKAYKLEGEELREQDFFRFEALGTAPAGGINSSVTDLLKYMRVLLDRALHGSRRIVSEAQADELFRPVTVRGDGTYALGWNLAWYRGQFTIQHGGLVDGFSAHLALFPPEKIGIVVLANRLCSGPIVLADSIADRLLGLSLLDHVREVRDLEDRKQLETKRAEPQLEDQRVRNTRPSLPFAAYAGEYVHPAFGRAIVTHSDRGLTLGFPKWSSALVHYHYDSFLVQRMPGGRIVQFQLDERGQAAKLMLPVEPSAPPIPFERKR